MIILDTSIWIEFLKANSEYFDRISSLLEKREILAVECVFGELLQGVRTAREQNLILKYWSHLPKIDDAGITIEAGLYSYKNKLVDKGVGLIDAIVLIHGIRSHSKIWTLDKRLQRVLPRELAYKN